MFALEIVLFLLVFYYITFMSYNLLIFIYLIKCVSFSYLTFCIFHLLQALGHDTFFF